MKKQSRLMPVFAAALLATGCHVEMNTGGGGGLAGAWRGRVEFTSGAYAGFKNVEFLYSFNAGGTMNESSNYDSAPPGPPAYGMWKRTGAHRYEARYEFFITKPPAGFDEIAKGGGWAPDGHGVLTEQITLSADGRSFESTLRYELFDLQGKPVAGGGAAAGKAVRLQL